VGIIISIRLLDRDSETAAIGWDEQTQKLPDPRRVECFCVCSRLLRRKRGDEVAAFQAGGAMLVHLGVLRGGHDVDKFLPCGAFDDENGVPPRPFAIADDGGRRSSGAADAGTDALQVGLMLLWSSRR
jgi:hypothetical protein